MLKIEPASYFGNSNVTRKVLSSFLDFMNDRFFVERYDDEGNLHRYVKVPIHFANRERFVSILSQTNTSTINNSVSVNQVLPRMSCSFSGMGVNKELSKSKYKKISAENYDEATGTKEVSLTGVPVKVGITLNIMTSSFDDFFQIIEQIVPYFRPDYSTEVTILQGFEPETLTYVMDDFGEDFIDEFSLDEQRVVVGTVTFSVSANYYYLRRDAKMFNNITSNFNVFDNEDFNKIASYEISANTLTPVEGHTITTTKY